MNISRNILVVVLVLATHAAQAAPKPELWKKWMAHDPSSIASVDHSDWGAFLKRYVKPSLDGVNRLPYASVSKDDKESLQSYLDMLSATSVSGLNRNEQRAYWINLYNALTVKVVLDHYPVSSIRGINISPGLFSSGPWGKKLLAIEGEKVSLDDIEHRVLRPIWKDPRIHYAVNCASIGCPNLQKKPFTAKNADTLLDHAARSYINHPRAVRIESDNLLVSSIYEWFKVDFGGTDKGVIRHLSQYAEPGLGASLSKIKEIDDDHYDWALNDVDAD